MFEVLKGFTEQVTQYSTWFGQIWYLFTFLFRAVVVMTIGGDVYSDEQSEFKCSTQEVGCSNVCFNKFSKISHIRFWAFQLLAVATPTVLFHFFVLGVTGRIHKMKLLEEKKNVEEKDSDLEECKEDAKSIKRKKRIGKVRMKSIYDVNTNDLKDVAFTNSIHVAYYVNVIARVILEGIFIYISYNLFKFMDYGYRTESYNPLIFLWFRVPAAYKCEGPDIASACYQHTSLGEGGYVPCWISRPWEKTIFMRYMNVISALCFLLSVIEFLFLSIRGTRTAKRKRTRKIFKRHNKSLTSLFPSSSNNYFGPNSSTVLAVPVRLSSIEKYQNKWDKIEYSDHDMEMISRESFADKELGNLII